MSEEVGEDQNVDDKGGVIALKRLQEKSEAIRQLAGFMKRIEATLPQGQEGLPAHKYEDTTLDHISDALNTSRGFNGSRNQLFSILITRLTSIVDAVTDLQGEKANLTDVQKATLISANKSLMQARDILGAVATERVSGADDSLKSTDIARAANAVTFIDKELLPLVTLRRVGELLEYNAHLTKRHQHLVTDGFEVDEDREVRQWERHNERLALQARSRDPKGTVLDEGMTDRLKKLEESRSMRKESFAKAEACRRDDTADHSPSL